MRWALVASVLGLAALGPSGARAQLGAGLGDPSLEGATPEQSVPLTLGRALGDPDRTLAAPEAVSPRSWPGPQIQLGYSFYRLADGYGGGDVSAGGAQIFVQLPFPELRAGLLVEAGARDYVLGGDDLLVRGALELGYQLAHRLDPFVPHVAALFSAGAVVSKRFESTIAHAFGGGGIALGGELRVYRNLHLGIQVSYQRLEMDGAGYDVFMLRLVAGL